MIQRKAIVRKLPSVETLGCASVICSDKTGTLTQNKMSVTHLWLGGEVLEVTGDGYEPNGSIMNRGKPADLRDNQMLRRLLQVAVLCNNAMLYEEANETKKKKETTERSGVWAIKGDPTEGALTVLGAKAGLTKQSLDGLYRRTLELPFDSERKRMSVIVEHQGGRMACTKGAPDLLVQQCAYVLWDDKVIPFTSTLKQKVLAAAEGMAKKTRCVCSVLRTAI